MPELPDVEIFRRRVDSKALNQAIERVEVVAPALLEGVSARALARALVQHRFALTERHGKHLFVRIERGDWLVLHFGMDGDLAYYGRAGERPPYAGIVIDFDNGFHLAYVSARKLGRIALAHDPQAYAAKKHLGPDALALDRGTFVALARRARGAVKTWLMNQRVMAGVGNIYSDEILFQARLQPKRELGTCSDADLGRLFDSLRKVFRSAIAARADPERMPREFLLPARRADGSCPNCGARLRTLRSAGRTTYFCARCQH
jgi:formamidopyrimidine-DNA glycosylase